MKRAILLITIILASAGNVFPSLQDNSWTLEKCIEYALEQNIQVRKGSLNIEKLDLYSEQSRAQRLPSVNGSVSHNFNWTNSEASGSGLSSSNGSNITLNAGVTLFNASRISNQIKQSELELESGKLTLETTKESISLSILNAFLQVLYSEEQVKNSGKQIEATESQLSLAEERLLLKAISQSDYAQVRSQLASEKLTLANARSQLAIAKVNLMQLMELPVDDSFSVADPDLSGVLNLNSIPDVGSVYETALGIKPQIKNAGINIEISALGSRIAKAGYFPTITASAGLGSNYSNRGSDTYFGQLGDGLTPSAGFTLSIPVFQKKQVSTGVAIAEAEYRDAELSELNTRNELRKSIEQACLDVSSAQVEYEASLESYNATLESSLLSDEKFSQGMLNSVDYLVSKTNLIVAESKLLQSKYNLVFSYKILDFYNGIPLTL